ncbi:hypothetical protein HanIR_Chr15g0741901 [Helianthus annuus]|nr:hypothetical protein HanIR_Chr15g0741901 [Helianthus annuus]
MKKKLKEHQHTIIRNVINELLSKKLGNHKVVDHRSRLCSFVFAASNERLMTHCQHVSPIAHRRLRDS